MRFLCGVTEVLKPERWVFKSGGGIHLSRQQLPLKLAWAISIHKSQVSTGRRGFLLCWVVSNSWFDVVCCRSRPFNRVYSIETSFVRLKQDIVDKYIKFLLQPAAALKRNHILQQ